MKSPAAVLLTFALASPLAAAGVAHPGVATRPAASTRQGAAPPAPLALEFQRFGKVPIYGDPATAREVVLFVSGDGGWNLGVVDMARALASEGRLVAGVDIVHYLRSLEASNESCSYPASDFEALSQAIQRQLGRPSYQPPLLVGYSSGATLVYALLAQAPTATFQGAVSMGFCPDLEVRRPFCKGRELGEDPGPKGKGVLFRSVPQLGVPWAVLQGEIDQVCDPPSTERYVGTVGDARLFALPKVGHGFSVERNWMPQLKQAVTWVASRSAELTAAAAPVPGSAAVADLPLVELPAAGDSPAMAVILSGDGGWAGLDKEVGSALVQHGVPVVGWNSLSYYWKARTPESASADLARVLGHYLELWKKQTVIVVGYSFGADVASFLVSRLPPDLRARVAEVALLSPSRTAQFEFHVAEWLGHEATDALPVPPEIRRLAGLRVLCFRGDHEEDSACSQLAPGEAENVVLSGGHHFGGDYGAVAARLLERLE
jgi:type IV secretory pathway VirJ component